MTRDDISNPAEDEEPQHTRIVAYRDCCTNEAYNELDNDSDSNDEDVSDDFKVEDTENDDVEDLDGHGTQVAGIILRLAPRAKLLIARVCLGNQNVEVPEDKRKFIKPEPEVVAQVGSYRSCLNSC